MKEALQTLPIHLLSPLSLGIARAFGTCLAWACWVTRRRMANTTLTNLALCFPAQSTQERQCLARQSLRHTFQTITETGAVWLWPAQETLELITAVEGLNLLQQAKASGKGVLVLAPHLGNWEIFGLYLNTCGCGQTSQLYQAPVSPSLDRLVYRARSRAGARMIATGNKGVAELLKALRNGEIVGILPDQVPPESGGEYASFFGIPALTMTLFNRLQHKTGARVVVGYARREPEGFRIVFREPDAAIYAEDQQTALQALNHSIENVITEAPEQYQWEYKRFKRQPEGYLKPY